MAIVPKDKLLQIRLDADLLERFSAIADVHQVSVSALLRGVMGRYVDHSEQRMRKDAEWAATLASRAAAAESAESVKKQPVEPVVASEGALARKRRLEKEAKQAKQAKREDRR